MKNALKKFFGQQSILLHSYKTQHSSKNPEQQDVNVALPQRYTLQNQQRCYMLTVERNCI